MPRYKELRQAKDLLARQVAQKAGIDEGLYSKFENHRALPIPSDFESILSVLESLPSDVYEQREVTLLPSSKNAEATGGTRVSGQPDHYQMTVRLGNDCREVLTKEVLQKCGFKSIGEWAKACIERLKNQYEIILKAEKKPQQNRANDNDGVGSRRGIPLTNPRLNTILSKTN